MSSFHPDVFDSIDHLFRHRAGRMVSILTRKFGVEHIEVIEDSVQDALITAMKRWPYSGLPENQSAWLIQVAKNRVIDQLRRDSKSNSIDAIEIDPREERSDELRFKNELAEDQIRMIFGCCHPEVPADSRIALTLKVVGGFSVGEIARAYLAKDEAIAKMLTRAKQKLRTVKLEIPAGKDLADRLDSVLRALYLMFNEGYSASSGADLIRSDLCFEAIRLVDLLLGHPQTSLPKVHALAALLSFQGARLSARTDSEGGLLLLVDQDRSLWNRELLAKGLEHFRTAAGGDDLTGYHVEAEIASLHALALTYQETDWLRILKCYDLLLERKFSPVVALNRAVVLGQVRGATAALNGLAELAGNYLMTSFNLFHIARGHFLAELGRKVEAIDAYRRADELTRNEAVGRFIRRKIEVLTFPNESS